MSSPILHFSPAAFRRARARAGLSRTRLAATIDVSVDTIVNWEQGKTTPRVDLLSAATSTLDCSLLDLMNEDDPAGEPGRPKSASGGTRRVSA